MKLIEKVKKSKVIITCLVICALCLVINLIFILMTKRNNDNKYINKIDNVYIWESPNEVDRK